MPDPLCSRATGYRPSVPASLLSQESIQDWTEPVLVKISLYYRASLAYYGPVSDATQCQSPTKSGRQCRMLRAAGSEYCIVHMNHPTSVTRAYETLQGLSLVAVDVVEKALTETGEPCALCGHGVITPTKLKAAALVMDRVGMGPTLNVKHSGTVNYEVVVSAMSDDEFRAVDEIMTRVMARVTAENGLAESS